MYEDCWHARSAALLAIGDWQNIVPEEGGGSRRREGVGVPLPRMEAARQDLSAKRATDRRPGDTKGRDGGAGEARARFG